MGEVLAGPAQRLEPTLARVFDPGATGWSTASLVGVVGGALVLAMVALAMVALAHAARARRSLAPLADALATARRERDQLLGVVAGMDEGILMLDGAGRIALLNPALRAMLALPAGALGSDPAEVFRLPELQELFDAAVEGSSRLASELSLDGGGPPRWLQVTAARLQPELGGGVFAVFIDVTERRRLESLRRDFVANVSHELRTPVTAIRSAAETLPSAMRQGGESAATFADIIDRNAARLQALVEDLLDLSRIESRDLRLRAEELSLSRVVASVFELLSERALQRRVELRHRVGEEQPGVLVDQGALERVLTNLVDNAIKYSGVGSAVTVSAAREGEWVRVLVADTGVGIAAEHLPRLFERFYRVDAGRSRALGGTGLGLSIVKHLVEAMGGRVMVTSRVGAGTTFSFTVPAAPTPNPPRPAGVAVNPT